MPTDAKQTVFDVNAKQVGDVYAKALIGAAGGLDKVGELSGELDALVTEVLDPQPEFEQIFASEFISHEEKEGIIDRVLGGRLSADLLVFLKVLSAHGRLNCLRSVRQAVAAQYRQMCGQVDVEMRTAGPVDDSLRSEIVEKLRSQLGAEPRLTLITDGSLLGGIVVRVGDTVFDGSIATRLEKLRGQMVDRTVQEIETARGRFLGDDQDAAANA